MFKSAQKLSTGLLLYGLLNAALYASLLPLWEGFDEEFHYGYVQYLVEHHSFPVLGRAGLSDEINRSIGLLPMSYVMIENLHLHGVRTFDQFFALDSPTRHELRNEANRIPTSLRATESVPYHGNYEVHHAPLAYLVMAIPEAALSRVPLPTRVWIVRFLAAASCVILMASGVLALGSEAGLSEPLAALLLFLVFSCQMFWATIAHIGNDWLSVPLAVWMIVWGIRSNRDPATRNLAWLGIVTGLGLLSKAYFLVFAPLLVLAAANWYRLRKTDWRGVALLLAPPAAIAGPWYIRNLIVSRNLSGRIEESSGVTVQSAVGSLASIPWAKSIPFMARGAFWMGNSSFTDFSVNTMNLVLVLLALALLLYLRGTPKRTTEIFLAAPVLLFLAAMIYVAGSSYSYTKGLATAASPWYLQAVMPAGLCIALLGCQRVGRWGRRLASSMAILWAYVLAATYLAKLFPLYGGFPGGRSTLREILHWYGSAWPRTSDILATTAMAPPALLLCLTVALLTLLIAILIEIVRIVDFAPPSLKK